MRRFSPAVRALAVVAALLAAVAQVRTYAEARPTPHGAVADVLRAPFSAALEATLPEHSLDLVSIVAADIDDDGDVDVVASDASLNLFVWLNDGAGHLTRQRPSQSNAWRGQPADPTVDGGATTCDIPTQATQAPHLARRSVAVRLDAGDGRPMSGTPPPVAAAASICVPRAPPATILL